MSWLSDALDFEKFNLKEVWKTIKDDPERLLLGALTPVGSKVWGGLLGKDWESPTNMFGGPSNATFQKAQEAGINTGSARGMHDIAQSVAGMYAGGYGMGQLGGAGDFLGRAQQAQGLLGQQAQVPPNMLLDMEEERRRREEEQRRLMESQLMVQGLLAQNGTIGGGGYG